jgi:hypothetical protein
MALTDLDMSAFGGGHHHFAELKFPLVSPIVCLGIIFRDRTVFKIIMCPFARTEMDDDNLFYLAQCVMIQTSLFKRAPFFLSCYSSMDGWIHADVHIKTVHSADSAIFG